MNTWSVQDAKARFSELLERCLTEGPQMVTKRAPRWLSWCPWKSGGGSRRRLARP